MSEGGDDPKDDERGGPKSDEPLGAAVEPAPVERAITGWERIEGAQRRKPKRITLDMVGPPLALPDAPHAEAEAPTTTRLALPPMDPLSGELGRLERLILGGTPEVTTDEDPPAGLEDDGWGRSREMPPNAPPRPRASTPPPFNAALGQGPTVPGESDILRLVATRSRPPGSSVLDLEGEMIDRYALGDFTGALLAAELVLGKQSDHVEAAKCAASCRERLCHLHLSRLGGVARVLRVAVDGSEVRWLGLDHRAGFIMSRVDGASTVEELVDLSGMARHEALKILVELLDAGALKL